MQNRLYHTYMCDKSMKECMGMCYAVLSHSVVSDSATLWTVARQAPLSMGFCRQKYWSGLSCPSPGDLPNPGIESVSLIPSALAGTFFITSTTWETLHGSNSFQNQDSGYNWEGCEVELLKIHRGLIFFYNILFLTSVCVHIMFSLPEIFHNFKKFS